MPTHFEGTDSQRRALNLFIKLHRAADTISDRSLHPVIKVGLTPSQFGILETLYHLGPLKASQLADKHLKSRNNFTLVIDNLERMQLVTRCRNTEDRRMVTVSLTDLGRQKVQEALPPFVEALEANVAVLTPEEQEQLCNLLKILGTGKR